VNQAINAMPMCESTLESCLLIGCMCCVALGLSLLCDGCVRHKCLRMAHFRRLCEVTYLLNFYSTAQCRAEVNQIIRQQGWDQTTGYGSTLALYLCSEPPMSCADTLANRRSVSCVSHGCHFLAPHTHTMPESPFPRGHRNLPVCLLAYSMFF
jgi:hypothetical protein